MKLLLFSHHVCLIQVTTAPGFHLFPFRTEKLSPVTPMVLRNSGRVGSRRFRGSPRVRNDEGAFAFGNLINFCYICVELILYQRLKQIESMKIKVLLLAAVAVAFSFVVTSCGNKKAADSNATEVDSCCAAKTEQVCDSAKKACCQGADSAVCPKTACDGAKCDKPCEKK